MQLMIINTHSQNSNLAIFTNDKVTHTHTQKNHQIFHLSLNPHALRTKIAAATGFRSSGVARGATVLAPLGLRIDEEGFQ